ncbi:hypothetical protein ACI3PL_25605, partial [Lacticaseibacillus paracasei]
MSHFTHSPLPDSQHAYLFPEELKRLLTHMHQTFAARRFQLLKDRDTRQREFDQGKVPTFLDPNCEAIKGSWNVA